MWECSILRNYQSIKLNHNIKAGKIAVADLNGDGIYDYIIRTPEKNVDPGMPGTLDGSTYQIEAYLSDGTFLWSKDLGQGIEPGVWYSPLEWYRVICRHERNNDQLEAAMVLMEMAKQKLP